VDTTVDVIARAGVDAVTIRAVASTLGVSPMGLYRHIADRDDLVDRAIDRVLGQVSLPETPTRIAEREAWLIAVTTSTWRELIAHSGVADRLLVMGPTGPQGFRFMDRVCAVLALRDRSPDQVAADYLWLMVTVAAFATRHTSAQRIATAAGIDRAELRRSFVDRSQPFAAELPHLTAVAPRFESDSEATFRSAIGRVIRDITRPRRENTSTQG
jgi:AcrR family transcriptional regulator